MRLPPVGAPWQTAMATAIAYGALLAGLFVLLFLVPYAIFLAW